MTYTKVLVTSEGLFATSEDGKERVKFRKEDTASIKTILWNAGCPANRESFDIPEGFQVTVGTDCKAESACVCPVDDKVTKGCKYLESYALLTPLPKGPEMSERLSKPIVFGKPENSAHGYTEGAEPQEKYCELCNMLLDNGICPQCYPNKFPEQKELKTAEDIINEFSIELGYKNYNQVIELNEIDQNAYKIAIEAMELYANQFKP